MIEKPFFTGPFAPLCERFVSQKRAIGLVYETQAKRLRQFDNFCKDHAVEGSEITEELVTAYSVLCPFAQ